MLCISFPMLTDHKYFPLCKMSLSFVHLCIELFIVFLLVYRDTLYNFNIDPLLIVYTEKII